MNKVIHNRRRSLLVEQEARKVLSSDSLTVRKHWQQEENKMPEFLHRSLNHCPEEEALRFFQIASLCIQHEPERRPSMQQVLEMLDSFDPLPMPSNLAYYAPFFAAESFESECD